ncbi:MAG TPA: hypothetical protein VMJ10_10070 [Kofleriaceae bacterium]|nr:hypothetical protein [Kofleriaceae bacterium]
MRFPRFWARGRSGPATCWRWSDASREDAQQQADARAAELARLFASGKPFDRYIYGDRPLREEVVYEAASAVVTRNLYGALVLNTERAMFIDIDFGDNAARAPIARDALRAWAGRHPELGVRVYRTAAGLRGLVATRTFDPASDEALALLREAGSDPLYVKLCKAQRSFRARLTPKPWRVGMRMPPVRWPFDDAASEQRFRSWQAEYERASQRHSACELVETLGPTTVHAELGPLVELHDQRACSGRALA